MIKNSAEVFDRNWEDYEDWFERHKSIYSSELKALKKELIKAGSSFSWVLRDTFKYMNIHISVYVRI